jgi:hypothetical protein
MGTVTSRPRGDPLRTCTHEKGHIYHRSEFIERERETNNVPNWAEILGHVINALNSGYKKGQFKEKVVSLKYKTA